MDLSKGTIPILIVAAIATFSFSVGTVWNSSTKDLQTLQDNVSKLTETVREVQRTIKDQADQRLERRDLLIFCFSIAQLNKDFKCPTQ